MKHLFIAVALLFCANFAQSAPIGAVVQSTDYDAVNGVELKGAIQDLNNKPQSALGRSDLEDKMLRALIKTHGDRIESGFRYPFSDAEAALLKVGQYSTGKVAAISGTR